MPIVRFADICEKIGSGATPRGGKEAYCNNGIALIRSQNILDFSFSHDGLAYINDNQADKLSNVIVERGDVLLNITGDSVARACLVEPSILPARVNQHVMIIRGKKDHILSSYILYYLQWRKGYLLQLASAGATRNALTKGMIEQLEIELPELDKQSRIVSILDAIQKKIKTNQMINQNLQHQAETLYHEWFIDFKPFGGTMPETWYIGTLADLAADIICGKTPSTKRTEYYGSDTPFITIPDMHNQIYAVTTGRSLSALGAKSQAGKMLPYNSTCVSCIGTAGLVCLVASPSQTNQQINSIVPKVDASPYYIYLLAQMLSDTIQRLGSGGSTICNLNKAQFARIEALIPSSEAMSNFDNIIAPMFEAIMRNQQENQQLTSLRDTLLPKLLSGEIDVSSVEV